TLPERPALGLDAAHADHHPLAAVRSARAEVGLDELALAAQDGLALAQGDREGQPIADGAHLVGGEEDRVLVDHAVEVGDELVLGREVRPQADLRRRLVFGYASSLRVIRVTIHTINCATECIPGIGSLEYFT